MDGVEGASDLVRCEDVRSCAIDYAIRRDWTDVVVAMMGFEDIDVRRELTLKKGIQTESGRTGMIALKATLPSACSAYRLAWDRAAGDAVIEISTSYKLRLRRLPDISTYVRDEVSRAGMQPCK
jgi:hypothetical protein